MEIDCNTSDIEDVLNNTNTCNLTTTVMQNDLLPLSTFRVLTIVFLVFVIVFTIIGNIMVILAVGTTRKLRSITNFFVTNLAVIDFFVGTFVMPPAVASMIGGSWQFGERVCDVWIILDVLLCTASILSICAISIDRYFAVTQPLRYSRIKRSLKLATLMVFVVWVSSLIITSPSIFGWSNEEKGGCHYNQSLWYVIFSALGSFFIPTLIMLFVYCKISSVISSRHRQLQILKETPKQKKFFRWACLSTNCEHSESTNESKSNQPGSSTSARDLNDQSNTVQTNMATTIEESIELHSCENTNDINTNIRQKLKSNRASASFRIDEEKRISLKKKPSPVSFKNMNKRTRSKGSQNVRVSTSLKDNKTTKTLIIVMGVFIFCWAPFFVLYLVTPFIEKSSIYYELMNMLTWLGWFNSTINPLIYAFYSQEFRVAFWRLTFKKFCKNKHGNNFSP